MFSEKELNLQESELRARVRALPDAAQAHFHALEMKWLKLPQRYLQLNWLFPIGVHHFYLQRWARGGSNLLLSACGVYLLLSGVSLTYGSLLLLAMALIELPQLINARHLVHNRNNQIMQACLIESREQGGN